MMMTKRLFTALLALLFLLLPACGGKGGGASETTPAVHEITNKEDSDVYGILYEESAEPTNYVRIEMVGGGVMFAELYPETAPITVANFKELVSEKFYDGLIFHRVVAGFMIQGGDIDGDGYANPGVKTIKGEFAANGVNNPVKHLRGVLSMARSNDPDSASTQFFIMHVSDTRLDGSYATFGKLLAGYDVLDQIASVKTNSSDRPLTDVQIRSIRFVTLMPEEGGAV